MAKREARNLTGVRGDHQSCADLRLLTFWLLHARIWRSAEFDLMHCRRFILSVYGMLCSHLASLRVNSLDVAQIPCCRQYNFQAVAVCLLLSPVGQALSCVRIKFAMKSQVSPLRVRRFCCADPSGCRMEERASQPGNCKGSHKTRKRKEK